MLHINKLMWIYLCYYIGSSQLYRFISIFWNQFVTHFNHDDLISLQASYSCYSHRSWLLLISADLWDWRRFYWYLCLSIIVLKKELFKYLYLVETDIFFLIPRSVVMSSCHLFNSIFNFYERNILSGFKYNIQLVK